MLPAWIGVCVAIGLLMAAILGLFKPASGTKRPPETGPPKALMFFVAGVICLIIGGVAYTIGFSRGEHGWDGNPLAPLVGLMPYLSFCMAPLAGVLILLGVIIGIGNCIWKDAPPSPPAVKPPGPPAEPPADSN